MYSTLKGAMVLDRVERLFFTAFIFALVFTMFNRELLIFGQDARILPALMGIATACVGFINCLKMRQLPQWRMRGTNQFLVWYFIFALVSNAAWLSSPLELVKDQFLTVLIANCLNLFMLVVIIANRRKLSWRVVVYSVYGSGVFLVGSMIFTWLGGDLRNWGSEYEGGGSDGISSTPFGAIRYAGYAQDPNFASLFLVILGAIGLFEARRTRNWWHLAVVPVAVFGYLMALSKAVLAMVVLASLFALTNKWLINWIGKELLLICAFGASVAASIPGLLSLPSETMSTRTLLWQGAMSEFLHSPIIGNGLTAARSANLSVDWYVQIHNTFIQSLMEVGIIGALLIYLAVRRTLLNGSPLVTFVTVTFLGTFLTYESMSHSFSVFVLALLPLAVNKATFSNKQQASVYVINGLATGGAERVVQNMANNAQDGEKVIVYTLAEKTDASYNLNDNVEVRAIGTRTSKVMLPLYLLRLNRNLENDWVTYDIVLATAHLPFAQILTRLSRFDGEFMYVNHGMYGLTPKSFGAVVSRWIYRDRPMVSVSQQLLDEELNQNYKIRARYAEVIHNLLDFDSIDELLQGTEDSVREKRIISVGRYSSPKNLSAGIAAFQESKLAEEGYVYELFGQGEERELLQKEIEARGLESSVRLAGFTSNPYAEMKTAACMLHPARYEAFPMALIEAHYCKCPIAAFDVPFGARETMPGGLRDYLAPFGDIEALAANLRKAVAEPYPGEDADEVVKSLKPNVVMGQYYAAYAEWMK